MPTSPPTHLATLGLVALGGALGALLRASVGLALPAMGAMPTGTLAANLIGCLLLGYVAAKVATLSRPPAWLQQGVGVGLLGSFTSTSTFASEAFWLVADASPGLMATYVALSLAGGLALAALGARLGGAPLSHAGGGA
ncbi:CrcB family protein [Lujinxingia vulgaris]|uniref:Fluoride-specific ion channel FluC n=1 Tax=Lujinxingia vulgaris TaxID=2600176 RepID=A0A5C6XJR0_9DELT|nr:CrcB family protein [Lujinxingia vulgaris]TXD39170.1 CrcB family protein [Lujinxingia vulgaris]